MEVVIAPVELLEFFEGIDKLLADYPKRGLLDSRSVCDDLLDLRLVLGRA